MDVQVADSGPCQKTITITVAPEQLKAQVDEVYNRASGQARIPGFRPGKVPRKVLEKKFGEALVHEVKDHVIQSAFQEAMQAQELQVVGSPRLEGVGEEPVDPTQPFTFEVEVDIRPEVTLKRTKGIAATRQSAEVTDEDVEQAITQVTDQRKALNPVKDAEIEERDFFKADISFRDDSGSEIHKKEAVQLNTDIPVAGVDPQLFKDSTVGKKSGDTVECAIEYPETFEKEEARGKQGTVLLTIHDILRVQAPELDDELAKEFGFDSADALRSDLRERIGMEKQKVTRAQVEEQLLNTLAEETEFPIPASMVEDQKKAGLESFEQRMKQAQMPEEEIKSRLEEAEEEAVKDAERRVRMFFLIEAVAHQEEITVSEEDIRGEFERLSQEHNVPVETVQEHFGKERSQLNQLQLGLLEGKVRTFLSEHAEITDAPAEAGDGGEG